MCVIWEFIDEWASKTEPGAEIVLRLFVRCSSFWWRTKKITCFTFFLADLKKTLAVLVDNIMLRLGKLESKVENIYNGTGGNLTNGTSTATPSATNSEKVNVAGMFCIVLFLPRGVFKCMLWWEGRLGFVHNFGEGRNLFPKDWNSKRKGTKERVTLSSSLEEVRKSFYSSEMWLMFGQVSKFSSFWKTLLHRYESTHWAYSSWGQLKKLR